VVFLDAHFHGSIKCVAESIQAIPTDPQLRRPTTTDDLRRPIAHIQVARLLDGNKGYQAQSAGGTDGPVDRARDVHLSSLTLEVIDTQDTPGVELIGLGRPYFLSRFFDWSANDSPYPCSLTREHVAVGFDPVSRGDHDV
jgi:hypothetical protein